MNNKNNLLIKHVEITKPLLDYLRPYPANGWSKWDAYHDLLCRASDWKQEITKFGQTFQLAPGEFIVTTTELAKVWKWSRVTVRKFIEHLVELDQLTVTTHIKCSQLDMIAMKFKNSDGTDIAPAYQGYTRRDGISPLNDPSDESDLEDEILPILDSRSLSPDKYEDKPPYTPKVIYFDEEDSLPSSESPVRAVPDNTAEPYDKV